MVGSVPAGTVFAYGRGFPTDFPMVGWPKRVQISSVRRGFPTDFPMVGSKAAGFDVKVCRGFPTDFPMVGLAWRRGVP